MRAMRKLRQQHSTPPASKRAATSIASTRSRCAGRQDACATCTGAPHEPAGWSQGRIPECAARRSSSEPAGRSQGRIPECAARRSSSESAGPSQGEHRSAWYEGTPMTTVELTVNGQTVTADVEPRTHLADFLREKRNLTGTNLGCEQGVCGACTLMLDGS